MWDVIVVDDGFQISLNTAYGSFQFVFDILGSLAFQAYLFFLHRHVIDAYFEAHILKDDTFYNKCFPVFIDSDRHSFFFFTGRPFRGFVDKVGDLFQFIDCKHLFGCL